MIPRSFTRGIYNPEYVSKIDNLNDYIENLQSKVEEVEASVEKRIANPEPKVPGAPLTKAEADQVDLRIENLLKDISETRTKIANIMSYIDTTVSNNASVNFDMDISKKKNLKKAIQKSFNRKTKTITYEMYKAALKAKKELEEKESEAYTSPTKGTTSGKQNSFLPVPETNVIGNSSTGVDRIMSIDSGSTTATQI